LGFKIGERRSDGDAALVVMRCTMQMDRSTPAVQMRKHGPRRRRCGGDRGRRWLGSCGGAEELGLCEVGMTTVGRRCLQIADGGDVRIGFG
jgi:hypothetical protein